MGQDVIIRHAKHADANEIFQVMRQSRQEVFEGLLPPTALDWDSEVSEGFRKFIQSTISHREKALLVAVCDETVVGLAELVWQPEETQDFVEESEAELKAIHVRPTNWNEGIGTKLLNESIDTLPSDVSRIALCVLEGNERARAFYDGQGFEQTGTTVTTHAEDEFTEAVYRRPL